jgi:chloramphenicol O-acetyltransferase type A
VRVGGLHPGLPAGQGTGRVLFLYYLHKSLAAANQTEPFRYRIAGEEVLVYDRVHASATINRPNGTFGFSYIDYYADFADFVASAQVEIERVQNTTGLIPSGAGENVIHYSAIPWLNFTGLSHARRFLFPDSCPKISFGKVTGTAGRLQMPVSVHAHHALMDGYHVGQYVDRFQGLLESGGGEK